MGKPRPDAPAVATGAAVVALMAVVAVALAVTAVLRSAPGPGVTLPPLGSPFVRPTPDPPGPGDEPAVLAGAGDIASCDGLGDEATADLLDAIEGLVFTAGDNVYDRGTAREFADCYGPSWGRFRDRTLPVLGNHEYGTAGAAGHFGYFGAAAGDPREGWYVTDVGTWGVYVLNSNCAEIGGCGAGSRQHDWLTANLAANPRACVLAIWHHPRFSSGRHGNQPVTTALWRALDEAEAEIVISGHDHSYERFGPQDADGTANEDGLIQLVVGTGGRSHYAFEDIRPNSLVRDSTAFGVLRMELGDREWTFEFVPVAGESFRDAGSGRCH
jgi:hypothetical protein